MNKKGKIVLYVGGVVALLLVVFIARFIFNRQYTSEIPEISDISLLSIPVKEQISEALAKAKRNPSADNLGMLGMVYHSSANYTEASKCYQLAIRRDKKAWIWNYYDGYLNMEMGNSDVVIKNFTEVSEKNPNAYLAWYYIGEEYKNQRNYEMGEKSFEKISGNQNRSSSSNKQTRQDHFPLNTYASFQLARIYFDKGQHELAENTLKEIINKNKLFGPSYKLLGTIYNLKGNTTLGEKYTVRASDLIIFTPPIDTIMDKLTMMSRSELYLLKKIDEAEDSFHSDWALQLVNQGLKYIPDNSYFISKAIKVYLWKNLNDKAIALIDKHLELIAGNYEEIKNTGIFFHKKGLYTEAMKYWTKALELRPDENIVLENQAKCLWATGDTQKAMELLDELINKHPKNAQVLAVVTDLLFQFGQKEKANILLNKLKILDPSNPVGQRISGEFALAKKDAEKAITLYESAFKGDPKDAKTIIKLGDIYKYKQMWEKYIRVYTDALEYNPNNPDYLGRLGEVLISCPDTTLLDFEKGREYSERAFTHFNCPPDILISAGSHLAYAYAKLGDMQSAITTISQTINIGRHQNISAAEQKKLEILHRAFQNLAN